MKQPSDPRWEEQLQRIARAFPYPPTPELATAVQQRLRAHAPVPRTVRQLRPVWAILLALLIVLMGLLAVPPVRAALQAWLQIGAVRIWLVEPTPTPVSDASTPLSRPMPTPLRSLFDLAGETTLTEAQAKVGFPIRLPSYPADLGSPDGVFFQDLGGSVVVVVWLDPAQPTRAQLSLHILGPNALVEKGNAQRLAQTTVNGQAAFWTEGPYLLAYRNGDTTDWDIRRLVEGQVLIWTEGELTYRLETDLSLTEAVRVAESLVALPPPLLNFAGKTTLAKAQNRLTFPLRLPTTPPDLGKPDHVFVQQTNGWFAVLVWMEPTQPAQIRLVLYEVGPGVGLTKGVPPVLRRTVVNGQTAAWLEGIHYLEHAQNGWNQVRLIDQDVLVWRERVDGQEITYRLESALTEEQTIQIAASLR